MKKSEAQSLPHGVYRIFWKTGGQSVAAVGSDHSGSRWLAPSNWTAETSPSPAVASTVSWFDVERVELIESTPSHN